MSVNLEIETNSDEEFDSQIMKYISQGYSMERNFNDTAYLKKKSFSIGIFIILLFFFFPAAILYYFLVDEKKVTIHNNSKNASGAKANPKFDLYCEKCGQGLFKNTRFCPECGAKVPIVKEDIQEDATPIICKNCGINIMDGSKICPECGNDLTKNEAEE